MMATLTIWDLADRAGNVRVKDVAAVVGVDRQTIYKFVACGLLPCRRLPISGRMMFKAGDVERFMSQMAVDNPSCSKSA
jgi:predicted DNA-binding transcriptional regulator AlpA